MRKIILASASQGRKRILKSLGIPFEVVPSNLDEDKITGSNPVEILKTRARAKAETVIKKISNFKFQISNFLIIAADSSVILNGKIYGKPRDKKEARKFLAALSGKTHDFVTAVCVIQGKKVWQAVEITKVTFRKLKMSEIDIFVKRFDLIKFAGAYSLFDTPQDFIAKIEGSLTNVLGLPLEKLLPVLRETNLLKIIKCHK